MDEKTNNSISCVYIIRILKSDLGYIHLFRTPVKVKLTFLPTYLISDF